MLQEQKQHGKYIQKQLRTLKNEIQRRINTTIPKRKSFSFMTHNNNKHSFSDLYDKVTKLTNDITTKIIQHPTTTTTKQQYWITALLKQRRYLISPRSRFSVIWRMTVTNCLLLEITRLIISWQLTKTFQLSITQVLLRLFVNCASTTKQQPLWKLWIVENIDKTHHKIADLLPFLPFPTPNNAGEKLKVCVATSFSAKVFLQLGFGLESFIDIVSFMDIFFWFFTGDLDEMGIVVPKPFLTRCIIPGTLVQVLDHPTLPEVLPTMLRQAGYAAAAAGWSRTIRWVLAISPALGLLVVQPLTSYFFRHVEEDYTLDGIHSTNDLLLSYAESFGYLPQRPSNRNFLRYGDIHKTQNNNSTAELNTMSHQYHQAALLSPYPTTSRSSLQSHHLHTPNLLQTIPSITRTATRSTIMDNNSSDDIDDNDYDHHHDHHDDDDGIIDGEDYFNMMKGGSSSGGGGGGGGGLLNSSVRFSHRVTVMDRLDSVDSGGSGFDDSIDYDNGGGGNNNNDDNDQNFNDSSRFDIGYSLSARDLQDLHPQESQEDG